MLGVPIAFLVAMGRCNGSMMRAVRNQSGHPLKNKRAGMLDGVSTNSHKEE